MSVSVSLKVKARVSVRVSLRVMLRVEVSVMGRVKIGLRAFHWVVARCIAMVLSQTFPAGVSGRVSS